MQRRDFITLSSLSPLCLLSGPIANRELIQDFLGSLVAANDSRLETLMRRQEADPNHIWFGGIMDSYDIHSVPSTSEFIKLLAASYSSPASKYFRSQLAFYALKNAAGYLHKAQHADGTIDLYTTNFHSPPDTAFTVDPLAISYSVLSRLRFPELDPVLSHLKDFLLSAGEALLLGGIHTPNHRWVVSAALAWLYSLFSDRRYRDRAEEWLREGIDIDGDGQYSERSAAIYSPTCNRAFLTMARFFTRPDLLEPVRRNLEMTLYYVHPAGEVVTEASRRQDKYQRGSLRAYFLPCRRMAILDQNGRFARMANFIASLLRTELANDLLDFLEDPLLSEALPAEESLPENYLKWFPHSDLVRIRRRQLSATIAGHNPVLFSFRKGHAALEAVRLASAFFGKGQFQAERMEVLEGRIILSQNLSGPYYQPLPVSARHADGKWDPADLSLRRQSEVQHQSSKIIIMENEKGFELTFQIGGTARVPLALELAFRKGGLLEGPEPVGDLSDAFFLPSGFGIYRSEGEIIRFGPGARAHRWTQLRGALPKLEALSVYLTGFTPFQFTLQIS
jgi:hypothetical protein